MDSRFIEPKSFNPQENLVPDRHIVQALLLNEEDEIFLFKRSEKNIFFPGYYHILSEKLEKAEDPVKGLIRGILEETGIEVSSEDVFKMGDKEFTEWNGGFSEVESYCVRMKESDIELNRENSEYILIKASEISDFKITPIVKDMLDKLEIFTS